MLKSMLRRLRRPGRRSLIRRLSQNPIVTPEMLPAGEGGNINGPSLVRVPDWAPRRLGRYYLYFAHHHGTHIRLAYADRLEGPWTVYAPGTLRLAQVTACRDHIASPDVHVDEARKQFRMYFHGATAGAKGQRSYVATSPDGIDFAARPDAIGNFYMRAVPWRGQWFAMAKGGVMYISPDGLEDFRRIAQPAFPMRDEDANLPGSVRHVALDPRGDAMLVYYTKIGDAPESILRSRIALDRPEAEWRAEGVEVVARPETPYEGVELPVRPSRAGATAPERALRDPAIFRENGRTHLLYSAAGESCIAIAELACGG